jgi:AcrR family transcriptional regulator
MAWTMEGAGPRARTVNPAVHAARRAAFVDAAVRLTREKGYDRLVIADGLAAVGASKGAFQHYFDSKDALLAAVVDRTVEKATGAAASVAADRSLTSLEKLRGLLAGTYSWKAARARRPGAATGASPGTGSSGD